MKPRIIVCGLGRTGYKIFCLLKQQGALVTGVDQRSPSEMNGDTIVVGDLRAAKTLLEAGIKEAHTLVLAAGDDALNLAVLTQARVLNPKVRIINRLFNSSLGDRLDHVLPDHVSMSVAALAAPVFAFSAMGNRAIGQVRLFEQLWPIREEVVDETHPWLGRKLSDLWDDRGRMLIYYLPENSRMDLISAVMNDQELQWGDRLIMATKPQVHVPHRTLVEKAMGWMNHIRQFQEHVRPTVMVMLLLLLTILGAALLYTGNVRTDFIDALYFSVGMITGAGGNESVAERSPSSIKLFTVVMMLLGTGVIGICYALLNDLVLGTRLQQLWQVAPVPRRNHYIVCGLGGMGVQTVRLLQASGGDLVVIEKDPQNRFLNALRALKVPVIIGDASIASTLQEARIETARTLLAVTSDDVANLEIALTAKGLAPRLSMIVRNQDPQFAPLSQQVFDFEAVLSPVDLAAPSFAAAALGGRILGNGLVGDSLWVALATLITPGHPFCNRQVQHAAMDADFVPLYLERKHQTTHGWMLLEVELQPDDVLYLTMPANQLEQLWRSSLNPLAVRMGS